MKRFTLFTALLICFVSTVYAQAGKGVPTQTMSVRTTIAKLEQENNDAHFKGDKAVLERLYDDDFSGVTAAGTYTTKNDVVTFYAGEEGSPMAVHSTDKTEIRVFDKTVVVTARLKYQYNSTMTDQSVKWMRYTRIYVFKENKWLIVAEHFSFLKAGQ